MKPTLGFIGLGFMGAPMAMRLLNAGYPLHVYNRTKEKAGSLLHQGAVWKNSPAECAEHADIIFSMVTNDSALRDITTSIQTTLTAGKIHIDCSTVSPKLTAAIEKEYRTSGRSFLHSPVLGSIPQATEGTLLLFVGGSDEAFTGVESVLKILGSKIWRFSAAEHASNTKLIMNSFIAGMIATLSQAFAFAKNSGVDRTVLLDILQSSSLHSPMYQAKGKSILEGNFSPRFFLENLLKDTNLFRDAAQAYSTPSPIADTVKQMLEEAVSRKLGKEDYSAVIKILP